MGSISKNRLEKDIELCFYLCQTIIDRNDLQNESDKVIKSDVDSSTDTVIHRKVFRNVNPQGFQLEILSSPRSSSSRMQSMSSLKASEVVNHVPFFEDDKETCCKITESLLDKIHNNKDLYLKCVLSVEIHGSESIKEQEKHTLENRKTPVCKWFDAKTNTTEIRDQEVVQVLKQKLDQLTSENTLLKSKMDQLAESCKCKEVSKSWPSKITSMFSLFRADSFVQKEQKTNCKTVLKTKSRISNMDEAINLEKRDLEAVKSKLREKESELSDITTRYENKIKMLEKENVELQKELKKESEKCANSQADMVNLIVYIKSMQAVVTDRENLAAKVGTDEASAHEMEDCTLFDRSCLDFEDGEKRLNKLECSTVMNKSSTNTVYNITANYVSMQKECLVKNNEDLTMASTELGLPMLPEEIENTHYVSEV